MPIPQVDSTWFRDVEQAVEFVTLIDASDSLLYVNHPQPGSESHIGRSVFDYVEPTCHDVLRSTLQRARETGLPQNFLSGARGPNNETYTYSNWIYSLRTDEAIDRVMMVTTDITDRFEAEQDRQRLAAQLQQAQKMKALGKLSGGLAHDFNNLLTAISNSCELAKMTKGNAEKSQYYIDLALESVQRASMLTRRLLGFSRKQSLSPKNVDANSLVNGMQQTLQRTLGETIEVRTSTPAGIWTCHVDPSQLENAVLNLAVNARDAMPSGGELRISNDNVRLEKELFDLIPPGEYVRIAVNDNGTGMSPEVVSQAFEPFFTTKEVGLGSGLGLSVVYGFVRQSGGYVRVDSNLGSGTTIEIYLPRIQVSAEQRAPSVQIDNVPRGNNELVLLVDDDQSVLSSTKVILQMIGYRTETAENAVTAIELLSTNPGIQLVLSDVVLSGDIDGFELAARARSENPSLPVLLMSGYPERVMKQSRDSQRITVLEKPHSLEQLARALRDLLGSK
jgi:signal transduction histidine kinase/CheY-like chemotaxis protein